MQFVRRLGADDLVLFSADDQRRTGDPSEFFPRVKAKDGAGVGKKALVALRSADAAQDRIKLAPCRS